MTPDDEADTELIRTVIIRMPLNTGRRHPLTDVTAGFADSFDRYEPEDKEG